MAIEFCPLADDVGNLADWMAVFVGALAAIATTVVAVLAYKTSSRATAIAGEAKTIAERQHSDSLAQIHGTARILGSLLQIEIGVLPSKLAMLLRNYDATRTLYLTGDVDAGLLFERAIGELRQDFLPASKGVLEQLHTLPNHLGALVAQVIGMTRDISSTGERVSQRFARVDDMEGGYVIAGYGGGAQDFDNLRNQIRLILRESIRLAEAFGDFTNVDWGSYEDELAAAEADP
ncbi:MULTISPECIES: hypothetical protein [unclassified Xanthomonas]|uniref:hypothetical protein n=1 Tax=unclassified Xanthomonas TaxID=2643310 RepID=UPI002A823158|nr:MULTISPECIES: hypothetical protein [unclassified Xanthomonas]MDY4296793.1 hypothetical protein [Xanthomonas sp. LF02-5]MDY4358448.1 hypothetical protein [Xanthomonas sp. LF04-12]